MEIKNYTVYYRFNNLNYHMDFSSDAETQEQLKLSALYAIGRIHDGVTGKDISRIDPETE